MSKIIVIGTNIETGQPVIINEDARRRCIYPLGIQGTGKTTVLKQIGYQDMVNGDGLLFIDPHGDAVQELLERVPAKRERDIIFWNPEDRSHPIGISPFYCPNLDDFDAKADSFVATLAAVAEYAEIFKTAPQMKNILHHLAIAFVVNQGHTLIETPRFLQDEAFRQGFYPKLNAEYRQVREFWEEFDQKKPRDQDAIVASTLNKLQRFGINRTMRAIFGQSVPKLNLKQVMDHGKIVLVSLNREKIGPDNAALIGSFMISELLQATLSRVDTRLEERRPFHVIADEFQNFMSSAFPSLIAEGRKYGMDVTIAHQVREQLAGELKELTRAVGNIIVFRVTAPNADALAGEFKVEQPKPVTPLVSDPWKYLQREGGGHTNSEVYGCVAEIQAILEDVSERYGWEHEHGLEEPSRRLEKIHRLIEEYLYGRMMGEHGPSFLVNPEASMLGPIVAEFFGFRDDDWQPHSVFTRAEVEQAKSFFEARFAERKTIEEKKVADAEKRLAEQQARWDTEGQELASVSRSASDLVQYNADMRKLYREFSDSPKKLFETLQGRASHDIRLARNGADRYIDLLEKRYKLSRRFAEQMERLGDLLAREPITTTAQTYEMPRTQADLRAEIAGRLTNLEKYRALCKLEGDKEITNALIVTNKLDVPADIHRARRIQRRSQEEYGACEPPQPFGTMRNDGRPRDDNPDAFGEKKTAHNSGTSTLL